MKFKKETLPNGVRVIVVPLKGNPSTTTLILCETGSKYESKAENGLSHFLEHMCFKGTTTRPNSKVISLELESIGAYSNAFTGSEMTGYYAKAENRHFTKIIDVLSDIYLNPTFPEKDVEIERGVILEEMGMYEDRPQAQVGEEFFALLYGDTPAGRRTIGTAENVKGFKREDLVAYHRKHYTASKTIVVVAGDVSYNQVVKEVKKRFGSLPKSKPVGKLKVVERQTKPEWRVKSKPTNQAHLIFAFRSYKARDKRSAALSLLATILGEGFSSRLWHKMREELGACYYIGAVSEQSTDHGYFAIPTGVNPARINEVVPAILAECQKLAEELVSEEELAKAKEYFIGKLWRGVETSDDLAEYYAAEEITTKSLETPRDFEHKIRAVKAKEIRTLARSLFKEANLNLAVVGDVTQDKLAEVLTFK